MLKKKKKKKKNVLYGINGSNENSMSMRKPTMWFLNRSDTNWAVQPQKTARSLKFGILEEEGSRRRGIVLSE